MRINGSVRVAVFLVAAAVLAATGLVPAESAPVGTSFPYGVAALDVRPDSAILWTRTDGDARVRSEVATDPSFRRRAGRPVVARSTAATDHTVSVTVDGLPAGQRLWYRFSAGRSTSPIGTFVTPPQSDVAAALRLVYAGDWDTTLGPDGTPPQGNLEIFDRVAEEQPDIFVALGDTIYSDSGVRNLFDPPIPPAMTLGEYRDAHRTALGTTSADGTRRPLQDVRSGSGSMAIWDDHEVHNDYDGQTVDPTRYANGIQAFKEYWPVEAQPHGGAYRSFRWGQHVELFVLDERSYRSADVAAACFDDPAPTLPSGIRVQAGLPADPAPGCLDAINDPTRTFLGGDQLAWFKDALTTSDATWKLVVNELAIGQLWGVPYDRWEGYAAERADVINHISANGVKNVVWLTTDLHTNLVQFVNLDKLSSGVRAGREFINGPVQTNPLLQELIDLFGPAGAEGFVGLISQLGQPHCANLDVYSYALVEVGGAGSLTVSFKTADPDPSGTGGTLVESTFPTFPFSFDPCTVTMQPQP